MATVGGGGGGGSPKEEELATVTAKRKAQWWRPTWLITIVKSYLESSQDSESIRTFRVLNEKHPKHEENFFPGNSVSTAKYTIFTFIPRALFEQFRRLANVYFLVITVLMLIGTYTTYFDSPLTPYTTLIPLCVVLAITMGKEGFEDLKRHAADRATNARPTQVASLTERGALENTCWRDLRVGRIVRVNDRQEMPADILLLTSSEAAGICYIETSNIDGETNLKVKQAARTAVDGDGPACKTLDDLHGWEAVLECEAPNSRIHFFTGRLILPDGRHVAVDQNNFLLRGSTLRNTKWVLGLVVYTGYDTKIVMNSRAAPSKLSTIERTTNRMLYLILGTQVVLVTISLIAYIIWTAEFESDLDYLCYDYTTSDNSFYADNCESTEDYTNLGMWFTFLILYNNFVPISLYVSVEMVNYIQAYYIDQDVSIYDPVSDTPALARTSNMNGDLAAVQYVFSDKTGTLTQNIMKFRRCSVAGHVFGNAEASPDDNPDKVTIDGLELSELSSRSSGGGGGGSSSAATTTAYAQFLEVLSVCHTVVVETDEEGARTYQAESPDEEALVSAARDMHWEFTGRSATEEYVRVSSSQPEQQPGGAEATRTYKILALIPFSSTRKRMSIVVRTPEGKVVVLTKGADNVIFERAGSYLDSTREVLEQHLQVFAADGLRTLVLARKEISESDFRVWHAKFEKAATSVEGRVEKINEASEDLEMGLTVVGATAIEDKLQDGVPATIAHLLQAGCKVWVLTGDKMETAINIGYSCRLLQSNMVLIKIMDRGEGAESVQAQLRKLVLHFERLVEDHALFGEAWRTMSTPSTARLGHVPDDDDEEEAFGSSLPEPLLEPQADAPSFDRLQSDHLGLIIEGPALVHIFGDGEMERLLLKIAVICKSVVACRVSPAQKRMIVRLVKKGVDPKPITLAIGDGANDVAMIQEAQIGVGISGREGRQAVNSSDFAIAQFRFLEALMLRHGRWNYRRISKVILYSFYKNIVLTMVLFYFSFYTGFSGQSLFQDYVYSGYNFFLAMPIICVGMFDRDIGAATVERFRWTYMSGRENMDLNVRNMALWLGQAVVDSVLIYFLVWGIYQSPQSVISERAYTDDIYMFGTTTFSAMFIAMMYKAANNTYTWTWVNAFFYFGSILLYLTFLFSYGAMLSYATDFYWVPYQMLSRGTFWLVLILVPTVSVIVDYVVIYIKLIFYPTAIDIAIEFDRGHHEGGHQSDYENPSEWFGGRLAIGRDLLTRLNATASQVEKDEMGLKDTERGGLGSSYDYSGTSVDYGPGAGHMDGPISGHEEAGGGKGDRRTAKKKRS